MDAKKSPSLLVVWTTLAGAVLCPSLQADTYFPHAVAGMEGGFSSEVEIELSAVIQPFPVFRRSARGTLRFFDQQGNSIALKVTGEGFEGEELGELPFEITNSGDNKLTWKLEGVGESLSIFWVEVEEEDGEVNGQLVYDLRNPAADFRTLLSVPSIRRSSVHVVSLSQSAAAQTGFAVANPTTSPVDYWLLALDRDERVMARAKRQIGPHSQEAKFVGEVFCPDGQPCPIPEEFDGQLALLSETELPLLALRQDPVELELTSTLPLDADGMRLPFVFGTVVDFLQRDVLGTGKPMQAGGMVMLQLESGGSMQAPLSPEGNFVLGPVEEDMFGEHTLRVEANGFCPLEQPVQLPGARLSISLTNLQYVNVQWLSATLRSMPRPQFDLENVVVRPAQQFRFRFDASRFDASSASYDDVRRVEAVQNAFKMWVWYELPELRLPVSDEVGNEVFFGGRDRYSEGPSSFDPQLFRMVVDPDLTQTVQTFLELSDVMGMPEILRAEVRFNPAVCGDDACALLPQLVSSTLWDLLFLRTDRASTGTVNPRDFLISGLPGETENLTENYTQISGKPQSLTSTPVDLFYWTILRERPVGTEILPNLERLPR